MDEEKDLHLFYINGQCGDGTFTTYLSSKPFIVFSRQENDMYKLSQKANKHKRSKDGQKREDQVDGQFELSQCAGKRITQSLF